MLGVNVSDQFRGFFDATMNRALEKVIPRYNQIAAYFRGASTKKNLHGDRNAANTVEEIEYTTAIKNLKQQSSGSLNPITHIINTVRWIFGNTQQRRLQSAVSDLNSYASQYNSFRFADDAIDQLVKQLNNRISDIEGWRSKFFGWHNSRVDEDATVKAIKKGIADWLTPYHQLLNGGVEEATYTQHENEFLESQRDMLRSGPKADYTHDLIANFEQVLNDAKAAQHRKVLGNRAQSSNPQTRNSVPRTLAQAS